MVVLFCLRIFQGHSNVTNELFFVFGPSTQYTTPHHTTHNKQEPTPSHFCHFIAKNSALYMTCIITHWQQHHPKMKSYFYLHSEYRHHLLIPYIECINTWLLFSLFSSRGSGWAVGVKGLCFMRLFIIIQCDSFIIHSLFVPCSVFHVFLLIYFFLF